MAHFKILEASDGANSSLENRDFYVNTKESCLFQQGIVSSQISPHCGFKSKMPFSIGNSNILPFLSSKYAVYPYGYFKELCLLRLELKKGKQGRVLINGLEGSGKKHMAICLAADLNFHYFQVDIVILFLRILCKALVSFK